MDEHTLVLAGLLRETEALIDRLKRELEVAKTNQATLEKQLVDRMPKGVTTTGFELSGGGVMTYSLSRKQRYVPVDGKSDDFWGWVQAGAHWPLVGRTLLQDGVEMYKVRNGALPPHLRTMETVTPVFKFKLK